MSTEWVVIGLLVALAIYAIVIFNGIVRLRNLVREGWSGIDVQLKRRTDLVPSQTVKGYAAHERGVLEEVTAKRASSIAAEGVHNNAMAAQELNGALGRLFAVAEGYPQLKADQNFLELQHQLAEVEDQLQMARRYYNGTVRNFNIGIQKFPNSLLAGVCGYQAEHFFELENRADAAAPVVSLSERK